MSKVNHRDTLIVLSQPTLSGLMISISVVILTDLISTTEVYALELTRVLIRTTFTSCFKRHDYEKPSQFHRVRAVIATPCNILKTICCL